MRNEFIGIEHLTDSEIETIRVTLEQEVMETGRGNASHDAVNRLFKRRSGEGVDGEDTASAEVSEDQAA